MLFALAVSIVAVFGRREWQVASSFLPQTRRQASGISALAAQIGVLATAADGQQTPQFYSDLVTSQELLRRIAQMPIDTGSGRPMFVSDLLRIRDADAAVRLDRTVRELSGRVESDVGQKTGVVSVVVRLPSQAAALKVNQQLLALVDEFNQKTRRSSSSAERKFVESRVDQLRAELDQVQEQMKAFLQSNRQGVNTSPQLKFEYDRLQRAVNEKQQVYDQTVQAFEQARIDEVRDTPVITVIDEPVLPARPVSRRVLSRGILSFLLAFSIGTAVFAWRTGAFAQSLSAPASLSPNRGVPTE
jgi:capsule polysaccharide export protein KpsE/RkpR